MSGRQAKTLVALAALGAMAPPTTEGAEGEESPPEPLATEPEPVDTDERYDSLRAELAASARENDALRAQVESQRAFFEERLQKQSATFDAAWEEREREIAAHLEGALPARATPGLTTKRRAIFDASVACDVDGCRRTFAAGDPVPDHIDPAALPPGAVRFAPEEG